MSYKKKRKGERGYKRYKESQGKRVKGKKKKKLCGRKKIRARYSFSGHISLLKYRNYLPSTIDTLVIMLNFESV